MIVGLMLMVMGIASAQWQSRDSNYDKNVVAGGGGGTVTIDIDCNGFTALISGVGATSFSYVQGVPLLSGVANSAVVFTLVQADGAAAITSPSVTWDSGFMGSNTAMTLINQATNGTQSVSIFGLRNPSVNAGSQSAQIAWTGAAQVVICSTSFGGVNQTSDAAAFKNFNSATNGTPISVNVTGATGDMQVAGFSATANFTSTNNTQQNIVNTGNTWATAFNRAAGSGTVTMTGNPGAAASLAAGIDVSP